VVPSHRKERPQDGNTKYRRNPSFVATLLTGKEEIPRWATPLLKTIGEENGTD